MDNQDRWLTKLSVEVMEKDANSFYMANARLHTASFFQALGITGRPPMSSSPHPIFKNTKLSGCDIPG